MHVEIDDLNPEDPEDREIIEDAKLTVDFINNNLKEFVFSQIDLYKAVSEYKSRLVVNNSIVSCLVYAAVNFYCSNSEKPKIKHLLDYIHIYFQEAMDVREYREAKENNDNV